MSHTSGTPENAHEDLACTAEWSFSYCAAALSDSSTNRHKLAEAVFLSLLATSSDLLIAHCVYKMKPK